MDRISTTPQSTEADTYDETGGSMDSLRDLLFGAAPATPTPKILRAKPSVSAPRPVVELVAQVDAPDELAQIFELDEEPTVPVSPKLVESPFEVIADAKHEERLTLLDQSVERIDDSLDEFNLSFRRTRQAVGEAQKAVARIDQTIGEVQQVAAQTDQSVSEIQQAVNQVDQTVSQFQHSLAQTDHVVGDVQQSITRIDQTVVGVLQAQQSVAHVNQSLTQFDQQIAVAERSMVEVKHAVSETEKAQDLKLMNLEERFQAFESIVLSQLETRARQNHVEMDRVREDMLMQIDKEVARVMEGINDRGHIGELLVDLGRRIQPNRPEAHLIN